MGPAEIRSYLRSLDELTVDEKWIREEDLIKHLPVKTVEFHEHRHQLLPSPLFESSLMENIDSPGKTRWYRFADDESYQRVQQFANLQVISILIRCGLSPERVQECIDRGKNKLHPSKSVSYLEPLVIPGMEYIASMFTVSTHPYTDVDFMTFVIVMYSVFYSYEKEISKKSLETLINKLLGFKDKSLDFKNAWEQAERLKFAWTIPDPKKPDKILAYTYDNKEHPFMMNREAPYISENGRKRSAYGYKVQDDLD